jgi:hypothetical protein
MQDTHDVPGARVERALPAVKPKLLVIELWGLGDLLIATPFLEAASQRYQVTLLAKPYAVDLQQRLWPEVKVRSPPAAVGRGEDAAGIPPLGKRCHAGQGIGPA